MDVRRPKTGGGAPNARSRGRGARRPWTLAARSAGEQLDHGGLGVGRTSVEGDGERSRRSGGVDAHDRTGELDAVGAALGHQRELHGAAGCHPRRGEVMDLEQHAGSAQIAHPQHAIGLVVPGAHLGQDIV